MSEDAGRLLELHEVDKAGEAIANAVGDEIGRTTSFIDLGFEPDEFGRYTPETHLGHQREQRGGAPA
jgi:hypothetical protein